MIYITTVYCLSIHSRSQLYFDNSLSSLPNLFNVALHSDFISRRSTVIPIEEKLLLKLSIWQFKAASSLIETIPGFILGPPLKIKFLKNPAQKYYTYFLALTLLTSHRLTTTMTASFFIDRLVISIICLNKHD